MLSTLLVNPQRPPTNPSGLSNLQGSIAQADVELSVISKNFFFTFFNFFIVFTTLGTASNFVQFFSHFRDSLTQPTKIAFALALSLQELLAFYVNYILLQGLGLFPLRLLNAGTVSLYPLWLMGAKTPRGTSFAPDLVQLGLIDVVLALMLASLGWLYPFNSGLCRVWHLTCKPWRCPSRDVVSTNFHLHLPKISVQ